MRKIETRTMYRQATIVPLPRANDEPSAYELSFSSEYPVERFFGSEILSHDSDAVDLERAEDGLPALAAHDNWVAPIGIVENVELSDRRLRGNLRLASTERAQEWRQLIDEGMARNVSVGYRVHSMRLQEQRDDGPDVYLIDRWAPFEVSLVGVPADPTVGVGRSADTHTTIIHEGNKMDETVTADEVRTDDQAPAAGLTVVGGEDHTAKAIAEERRRVARIRGVAEMHPSNVDLQAYCRACEEDGTTVDAFHARIIELIRTPAPPPVADKPLTEIGLTDREAVDFSILRLARAMYEHKVNGRDPRRIAPFELEAADAVTEQVRKDDDRPEDWQPRGILIPYDVQQRAGWFTPTTPLEKAMALRAPPMDSVGSGALVGTDHLAANFIEALRARVLLIRAGAIMVPGLVGNVDIPKLSTPAAFEWVAEDTAGSDAESVVGKVTMSPKTVTSSVPITRRLMKQSAPPVEQVVRNDLTLGAAVAIDDGGINGGTNAPTGIVNETGVQTVNPGLGGAQIKWEHWVEFQSTVAAQNAYLGSPAYLASPSIAGKAKSTLVRDSDAAVTTVVGRVVWEGNILDGMIDGLPAMSGTVMNTPEALFGDFAQVLIGMWGVLDLRFDLATKAATDGLVIRAFQDVDVTVRHGEAFSKVARA